MSEVPLHGGEPSGGAGALALSVLDQHTSSVLDTPSSVLDTHPVCWANHECVLDTHPLCWTHHECVLDTHPACRTHHTVCLGGRPAGGAGALSLVGRVLHTRESRVVQHTSRVLDTP